MNKILLKIILLFNPLWKSLGADTGQLAAILKMRITIDDRKPLGVGMGQRSRGKKDRKNGSIITALLYTFMGLMYALPVTFIPDRVFSMSVHFTLLLTIITLTLITDFSNTLFDNRDKYILFPRPISDRTLVLAKLLHLLIYLMRMVLPMSLATIGVLIWEDGWISGLFYLLPLMLLVCMALFFVNAIYLMILKFTKPGRFKDIISYFQIFASVVFFAIIYLRPKIIFSSLDNPVMDYNQYHWMRLTPPYWLASFWSWLGYHATFGSPFIYSIAGLATPVFCAFVLVRYLSPSFAQKIANIDSEEVNLPAPAESSKKNNKTKLYLRLANLFNRNNEARAGFILSWLLTARSRSFRMRVFPSFALIPFYFIYFITQSGKSIPDAISELEGTSKFLLLLYMSSIVIVNSMNFLVISDQYKAAWVFYSSPAAVPGKIMVGAVKALWVKYFLPFFIFLASFTLYIWGPIVLPDVFLALVNVTLVAACMARLSFRHLPFSMMEQAKQKGGKVIRALFSMLIPFALGFGHYFS